MNRISLLLGAILLAFPLVSASAVPETYTNENFWTNTHDAPKQFFRQPNGDFHGYTTTGKYFTQTRVVNDQSIHMFRFDIDRASFFITDQGVIHADNNLIALSIYLSRTT